VTNRKGNVELPSMYIGVTKRNDELSQVVGYLRLFQYSVFAVLLNFMAIDAMNVDSSNKTGIFIFKK